MGMCTCGPAPLLGGCRDNLKADDGAHYDQLIELNLTELEPHINGPFTPDLAHPLSKFAEELRKNKWPTELKVGAHARTRARVHACMHGAAQGAALHGAACTHGRVGGGCIRRFQGGALCLCGYQVTARWAPGNARSWRLQL